MFRKKKEVNSDWKMPRITYNKHVYSWKEKASKFNIQRRHSWMTTTREPTRHHREAWAQEKGTKKKSLTRIIIKNKLGLGQVVYFGS